MFTHFWLKLNPTVGGLDGLNDKLSYQLVKQSGSFIS